MPLDAPTWEDTTEAPTWQDTEPEQAAPVAPPIAIKPSPYEAADIASIEAGRGKAPTGMESGDEMLRAAVQAPRQIPGAVAQAVAAPFSAAGQMLNAAVQDVGATVTGHPGYGGNIYEFFNRTSPQEAAAPMPYQETLRDISQTAPVTATAGKIAAGLVESAPMMAVGMPEGVVGRLVALGFTADMIRSAGAAGTALGEEMGKPAKDRDMDKVTGALSELTTAGVLSPLMASHALRRVKSPEMQGPVATGAVLRSREGAKPTATETTPPVRCWNSEEAD